MLEEPKYETEVWSQREITEREQQLVFGCDCYDEHDQCRRRCYASQPGAYGGRVKDVSDAE